MISLCLDHDAEIDKYDSNGFLEINVGDYKAWNSGSRFEGKIFTIIMLSKKRNHKPVHFNFSFYRLFPEKAGRQEKIKNKINGPKDQFLYISRGLP